MTSNPKTALRHFLTAIEPQKLRVRLQSDLYLAHRDICKVFKRFMDHALDLSEAFE